VLAANELVTNAILHARTECVLRVELDTESIRIEVEDRDVTLPTRENRAPEARTGRGLVLVENLAVEWGYELLSDGKIVWCQVRRSA
jgi:anti-sigma regulatory factor (Ser/Thr protein kinase)